FNRRTPSSEIYTLSLHDALPICEVLKELIQVFAAYDEDDSQRCLVLTGSEKAFAAGADIKEMSGQGFADMYSSDFFAGWEKVTADRKSTRLNSSHDQISYAVFCL